MAALVLVPEAPIEFFPSEDILVGLLVLNSDSTAHDVFYYDSIALDIYINERFRLAYSTAQLASNATLRPLLRGSADRYSVTADSTTDRIALTAHGLLAGAEVRFVSGTMPTGLVVDTPYYVINPTVNDFQISATVNGAAINFTTNGATLLLTRPGTPSNRLYFELRRADFERLPAGDISAVITLKKDTLLGYTSGRQLRARSTIGRLLSMPLPSITL
jgi:subtilisin family serine protease